MQCLCNEVYTTGIILQNDQMINSKKSSHERKITNLIKLTEMFHFRNLCWFGYHLQN